MSKKTTSDTIKALLSGVYGGKAQDWARASRKKNAAGVEVRKFRNKKTGIMATVTELADGQFAIKKRGAKEVVVALPVAAEVVAPVAAPSSGGTFIETDPAKNAAADKVIATIMGDNQDFDAQDALVAEAGKALANRYCFAICTQEEMITAATTPIRYFEEDGHCSDQTGPIYHLLPKCSELMESSWEFNDSNIKTVVDAAKYLQQLGFVWSKSFQDFMDKSVTKELEAALEGVAEPAAEKTATPALKPASRQNRPGM